MTLPYQIPPEASVIIGIDPGVNGAVALLDTSNWLLGCIDMPTVELFTNGKTHREPSPTVLAEIIRAVSPLLLVCEKLQNFGMHPNPNDLMKMGRWRGQIEGLVAASQVGFEHPYPSAWKRQMGLTADKKLSTLRANALFPHCVSLWKRAKDHDRAEAALLALYGCMALDLMPRRPIRLWPLLEDDNHGVAT